MTTKATEQAFEDLPKLTGSINRTKSDIQEVIKQIEAIENLVKEILDDPVRKANLKKIIDIHPSYTITGIEADITKLKALKEKIK